MFKVGAIGFGGGSALIPVMERELVSPAGGLTAGQFVQDTVIANITPGALPVKIAALSGIQLGGPILAVASALAVALPGTVVTVALLAFFAALGPNAITVIEYASLGITAFILYLLAHYTSKVFRGGRDLWIAYAAIATVAFLLTGLRKLSALWSDMTGLEGSAELPELSALALVLLAIGSIAAFSIGQHLLAGRKQVAASPLPAPPRSSAARAPVLIAIAISSTLAVVGIAIGFLVLPRGGEFLTLITLSTLSSFGGGEAYVGVADGFFVSIGLVESSVFYGQIVPVANALPGPILIKVAAGMGYSAGFAAAGPAAGIALAVGATLASIGSCTAVALAVFVGYDRAQHSRFVHNLATFILPVICGLLASTSISMLESNARIAAEAGMPAMLAVAGSVVLASLVALVHRIVRAPDILLILICGGLSLGILLALPG